MKENGNNPLGIENKLYAIEEGERFSDLTVEPDALNDSLEAAAA